MVETLLNGVISLMFLKAAANVNETESLKKLGNYCNDSENLSVTSPGGGSSVHK